MSFCVCTKDYIYMTGCPCPRKHAFVSFIKHIILPARIDGQAPIGVRAGALYHLVAVVRQTHYIDPSNSIGVRPRIASGRLVWPPRLGQ